MASWQKNLIVIWLSQFLSIAGFSFSMIFIPYYMQELGITDPVRLKMYVSLFAAAAPLSLAVFSPIWGTLADRYGRRMMLLRANFGAMGVLLLMGMVTRVEYLLLLRIVQGALTGTMTAAQTLVSVNTPQNKSGLALGALSAAVYSGGMAGALFGGVFAESFGYRNTFYISSSLLLIAGLLVLFGVNEKFTRPESHASQPSFSVASTLKQIGFALPILGLIMAMAFVRQFDNAFLPLLVQEIQGSLEGAALKAGTLGALGGVAGLLAGIVIGRLADTISPPRIARWSALFAGLMLIPQGLATGFGLLFGARFAMVFFAGGLDPVFQIWLSKITPPEKRGALFGWATTAKSIGWILSPLAAGLVASCFSVRIIYFVGALLFLALIPLITLVVKRIKPVQ